MPSHKLLECRCPNCDKLIDSATNADNSTSKPIEGDITICFYCGGILMYDKDFNVEEVTTSFMENLKRDERETYDFLINLVIKIKSNL